MRTSLVIGFDSAWSLNNSGGMVGAVMANNDQRSSLGAPLVVNHVEAAKQINQWQKEYHATSTLILIDQPTVVPEKVRQRPVENIVGSPINRRYGGVQSSNRSKEELFGDSAPIWEFLKKFDGACNPIQSFPNQHRKNYVIETYPALAMIAMDWIPDDNHINPRATGRLPKYNPANRRKFSYEDWRFVCRQTALGMKKFALEDLEMWLNTAGNKESPQKQDQDCLDACICLLVGMQMAAHEDCLLVGNMDTGCIVVPYCQTLYQELAVRCEKSNPKRHPGDWIKKFKLF